MQPVPVGTRIRVIGNSNHHSYRIGGIYTVAEVDDSDGTLRASDAHGHIGNWLRWSDCEPASCIGWEYWQRTLPPDIVTFISAFDGLQYIELKREIADRILLSLPDLHERILEAARAASAETPAAPEAAPRRGGARATP